MPGAHCRSDDLIQLRYGLLATSQWDAQPSSMQLLHAAQVQPHAGWPHEHCQSLRAPDLLSCRVQRGGKSNQMGHTLWTSMTHHVQPELCGVAAMAELVIYDICRTGLPLLELIR